MDKVTEEHEILSDYVEELEKQVKDYQKDLLTCYTDLINKATELTEKDDEIARLKKQLEKSNKSSQEKTLALHPCPACGDKFVHLYQEDMSFLIGCPTCLASTDKWVKSLGEAVELWNRTIVKTKDEPYRS